MIFKREFSRNLKPLIIWTIVLSGLALMYLSIYPQMAATQKGIDELMKTLPDALKKVFGMDQLNMSTVLGFYSIEIYLMITLLGSIFAAILASNILAKEENEKTIEFLLSKPVTRTRIVTEKLSAVIVNIFILNGVTALVCLFGFQFTKNADIPMEIYLLLVIAAFLLHLTFAAVSFLLSVVLRKRRNILSLSLGLVFIAYFLNIMAGISDKLQFLKYITPFKFVAAAEIINDKAIGPLYLTIMCGVIVLAIGCSYIIYRKKDLAV